LHHLHTREQLNDWRSRAASPVALVATMGALHDGHVSHIAAARSAGAASVIVSIFVNPMQFGPNEDFTRYPRTLEHDLTACERAGTDAVFTPGVGTMYPPDASAAQVDVPAITSDLEGAFRPGHFAGVGRVVLKLFGLIRPDLATFGRKDYQQLALIKAIVHDLCVPVRIAEVPTMREPDGLAMSSRNRYLDADQRTRAVGISKALQEAFMRCQQGEHDPAALESAMRQVLDQHRFDAIDYAVVRHRETLQPLPTGFDPADVVALITARLGSTRLLDNRILSEGV
jgi:pantoate--beta-alanine ligase